MMPEWNIVDAIGVLIAVAAIWALISHHSQEDD